MVCTLDIVVLSSYSHYAATVFRIPAALCGLPQARPVAYDLIGQGVQTAPVQDHGLTLHCIRSAAVRTERCAFSHYYPRTRPCLCNLPPSSTRNATGYNRTHRAGTWSSRTSRSSPTAPPPAVQGVMPHLGYSLHYWLQPYSPRWFLDLDDTFTLFAHYTAATVRWMGRGLTGYHRSGFLVALAVSLWSWTTSRSSSTAPPPSVQGDEPYLGCSHHHYYTTPAAALPGLRHLHALRLQHRRRPYREMCLTLAALTTSTNHACVCATPNKLGAL